MQNNPHWSPCDPTNPPGGAGGPSGPRTSVASVCFLWTGFYSNFNVLSFRLPSRAPEPADARLKTMDMQMYQTALMIHGGIYSSIPSRCLLSVPDSTNPPISFFATAWCISPGALQQSGDLRISAPNKQKKKPNNLERVLVFNSPFAPGVNSPRNGLCEVLRRPGWTAAQSGPVDVSYSCLNDKSESKLIKYSKISQGIPK